METEAERALLEHALPHKGVFVEIGATNDKWARDVLALRPTLMGHVIKSPGSDHLEHVYAELVGASRVALHLPPMAPEIAMEHPLDVLAASKNIRRINCLKIDPISDAARTFISVPRLLAKKRIDTVRFSYRESDAIEDFDRLCAALTRQGYTVLKLGPAATRITGIDPNNRRQYVGDYLALAPRFLPDPVTGETILNIPRILAQHGIRPRGVIHIGAHTCQELPLYKQLGIQRILFIEANPEICEKIRAENARDPAVRIENYAISDKDGMLALHIMSESQSSSILPLKHHRDYYPEIHQTKDVEVPARRLDTLFRELGLDPRDYNYLHMDIQGAELLALQGAVSMLPHFDVFCTELNFDELYEGCGMAEDLEDFLEANDFHPASVLCPCSSSWADAFYVRGAFRGQRAATGTSQLRVVGKTPTGGHVVSFGN